MVSIIVSNEMGIDMSISEDKLQEAFDKWFDENMATEFTHSHTYFGAFNGFKAAFSPAALESLGVVICDAEPVGMKLTDKFVNVPVYVAKE